MTPTNRIDPRIRALGKARIDVTRRARDEQDFQDMWHAPRYPFPFTWGPGPKHCIQYVVEDFAAEVGFFIDVLGFPVSAFSPNYAQFTSPEEELFFGIISAPPGNATTPPETLRIQFAVRNLHRTIDELEKRGVRFDLRPDMDESGVPYAVFRTPHGVGIELLGIIEPVQLPVSQRPVIKTLELKPISESDLEDSLEAFWGSDSEEQTPATTVAQPDRALSGLFTQEASRDDLSQEETELGEHSKDEASTGDEIIYEVIGDGDVYEEQVESADEPTYEDVEETVIPVSVLPVKPRPTPVSPTPPAVTRTRRLDINLPPARLTRNRRPRSNQPSRYPTLDER